MSEQRTIECGEFQIILLKDGSYPGFKIEGGELLEVTDQTHKDYPRLAAAIKALHIMLGCMATNGLNLDRDPDDSNVCAAISDAVRLIADDPYLNGFEGSAYDEYATE